MAKCINNKTKRRGKIKLLTRSIPSRRVLSLSAPCLSIFNYTCWTQIRYTVHLKP